MRTRRTYGRASETQTDAPTVDHFHLTLRPPTPAFVRRSVTQTALVRPLRPVLSTMGPAQEAASGFEVKTLKQSVQLKEGINLAYK